MDFYEMVDRVVNLLQQRGRLTYRALKRQFDLDDDTLYHHRLRNRGIFHASGKDPENSFALSNQD
jgi:hypothetical protein